MVAEIGMDEALGGPVQKGGVEAHLLYRLIAGEHGEQHFALHSLGWCFAGFAPCAAKAWAAAGERFHTVSSCPALMRLSGDGDGPSGPGR